MEATFTWDDAGTGLPPPPVVVVKEVASATWSGQSGSASCGLSPATQTTSDHSGSETATKYTVIQSPGTSFTKSITPSGSANLPQNANIGLLAASCSLNYSVETYPVRINFAGVLDPNGEARALVGQKVRASIDAAGLSILSNSVQWAIDADDRFSSYVASPTNASINKSIDLTSVTIEAAHWKPGKKPYSVTFQTNISEIGSVLIKRDLFIDTPVSPDVNVVKGSWSITEQGNVWGCVAKGVAVVVPNTQEYKENYRGRKLSEGIIFDTTCSTPSAYFSQGFGQICYVQLLYQTHRYYVLNGVTIAVSDWPSPQSGVPIAFDGFPYCNLSFSGYFSAEFSSKKLESDSPAWLPIDPQNQGWSSIVQNDSHRMYCFYKPPNNGIASYPIVLKAYTWGYNVTCSRQSDGSRAVQSGRDLTGSDAGTFIEPPSWFPF